MDRKKFGHIFYTLTYLPIQKIWTILKKVCTFNMAFRKKHMSKFRLMSVCQSPFLALWTQLRFLDREMSLNPVSSVLCLCRTRKSTTAQTLDAGHWNQWHLSIQKSKLCRTGLWSTRSSPTTPGSLHSRSAGRVSRGPAQEEAQEVGVPKMQQASKHRLLTLDQGEGCQEV